jgi:CO/xanthine dehydrogenase Mo-binding subunit
MNTKISSSVRRVDAADKSRASARYIADLDFEGMLYARTLRADRPRARILSVQIPPLPDGYYVVDRRDAPASNRAHVLIDDWPFFAEDVVNHIGEPILLLVGPDRETLDVLLSRVVVQYEDLDPILTLDEAESGQKPPVFGADNCFATYTLEKCDPDGAFARAARIVEGEYRTGLQEHIYMEPQGLVATAESGKVTVYGSMQCPYYIKKALVEALGGGPDRVRVVQTTTGGAFGGKEEYPSLIAGHVAFAALKTGRPVRLIFDRGEDIQASTKRHPSRFRYRTALDANGRILGMEVDIRLDGGAYAGLSSVVLQRAMFAAVGVYHIENLRVRGRVLATNTVPTGAFRGFGAPQAFFAIEMHMTQIAQELGLDSLDFKMSHAYKKGDRTATSGLMRQEIKLPEIVARVTEMSEYRRKLVEFPCDRGRARRGIGVSLFLHGCGFTGDGEQAIIKARAKLV